MRKGAREECHARKALEHARGRTQAEGHRSAEGREEDSVSDTVLTDEDAHRPPDIHHRIPWRPGFFEHYGACGGKPTSTRSVPGQPRHPERATAQRQSVSRPAAMAGRQPHSYRSHAPQPPRRDQGQGRRRTRWPHRHRPDMRKPPASVRTRLDIPPGVVLAITQIPTPFFPAPQYRPWKTQQPPAWLGRGSTAQHVSCCLCSCMAWEVTPRLNPWGLVDVILSEGSTVMTVAKGQAPGPCRSHRSSCRPNRGMWWGVRGSNPRPRDYESPALTC